jgi:hypothetical protein
MSDVQGTGCRSPFEKTLLLPVRNVTPDRRTHLARNGITALRWVRAAGSRAATGSPARAARPFRPSRSPSIMRWPCAQPSHSVSVAAVTARRLDRGERVEVQIDDCLKRLRGGRSPKRLRQGIEPCQTTDLDVGQFTHGIAPTLDAAPAVHRSACADHDRRLIFLVARAPPRLPFGIAQRRVAFGFTASWDHRSPLRNAVQGKQPSRSAGRGGGIARIVVLEKRLESRVEIVPALTRSVDSPYYRTNPSGRVNHASRPVASHIIRPWRSPWR